MNKNIEVETRGQLSKADYDRLKKYLETNGMFVEKKERILIDYSTLNENDGMEKRTKDVRLRVTNGIPEIIIKIGKWGADEARKEISIKAASGTFDDLVEVFAHLGWKRGVLCVRNSLVYNYKDIEFALVEVPGHSYYFEAEMMIEKAESKITAVNHIKDICAELKLKTFTQKDFFDYLEILNTKVNEIFDYDQVEAQYFMNRFSV